jgi:hypothetical protein
LAPQFVGYITIPTIPTIHQIIYDHLLWEPQEKLCVPHGAPGVKFYAFEGLVSGKEPQRVQRPLALDLSWGMFG